MINRQMADWMHTVYRTSGDPEGSFLWRRWQYWENLAKADEEAKDDEERSDPDAQ